MRSNYYLHNLSHTFREGCYSKFICGRWRSVSGLRDTIKLSFWGNANSLFNSHYFPSSFRIRWRSIFTYFRNHSEEYSQRWKTENYEKVFYIHLQYNRMIQKQTDIPFG